jgi:hypothetical protein
MAVAVRDALMHESRSRQIASGIDQNFPLYAGKKNDIKGGKSQIR